MRSMIQLLQTLGALETKTVAPLVIALAISATVAIANGVGR